MVVNIISRFVVYAVLRVRAGKAQNSIKLRHQALEYVYTAPRSSPTRGQHCNGEFFRIAYSTAEISYVSTVSRCCIAKSSPLLDSSCRDGHRNVVSATGDALLKSLIDK